MLSDVLHDQREFDNARTAVSVAIGQLEILRRSPDESEKLRPDHAKLLGHRANYLYQLGKMDEATADIQKALALEPRQPGANLVAARVRFHRKEYLAAIPHLNIAITETRSGASLFWLRGEVYQAMGNDAMAQKDFTHAEALGQAWTGLEYHFETTATNQGKVLVLTNSEAIPRRDVSVQLNGGLRIQVGTLAPAVSRRFGQDVFGRMLKPGDLIQFWVETDMLHTITVP